MCATFIRPLREPSPGASGRRAVAFEPGAVRAPGAVLLISCYEQGHQPLGLVMPAARLEADGFSPALLDIAVEEFDELRAARALLVAISVPMHTALRLGIKVAKRVRRVNPRCHISFYGLYAALNAEHLLHTVADSCFGGEFEDALVRLAVTLDGGGDVRPFQHPPVRREELQSARSHKRRTALASRKGLPPLERYVKLIDGTARRTVGYVATTRGCKHLCLHCPIPPVYDGAFFAVPADAVLEDVAQLVDAGATHITFSDPDFFNGPAHARRIARAMHERFPFVTFDYTAKVEHLLRHRSLVRELQVLGSVFVVSAIESLNDRTLDNLKKGHSGNDVIAVIRFFKSIGLALRPSLLPFTPWDSLQDYIELLDMVEREGMIDHVDPVQYGVRLLVPPRSSLLVSEAMTPHLDALDREGLTYRWHHPDARMDDLQRRVSRLAEAAAASGEDAAVTFYRIRGLADSLGGRDTSSILLDYPADRPRPPRLSEDWFC